MQQRSASDMAAEMLAARGRLDAAAADSVGLAAAVAAARTRLTALTARVSALEPALEQPPAVAVVRAAMKNQDDFRSLLGLPRAPVGATPGATHDRAPGPPTASAGARRHVAGVSGAPSASDWSHLHMTRGQLSMQPGMLRGILKQSAGELRVVNLAGCGGYADDALVAALAAGCARLRTLNISDTAVSDAGLLALAANCPALEELAVAGCSALGDAGVLAVVGKCAALAALDCRRCGGLSAAAFERGAGEPRAGRLDLDSARRAWEQSL